jgi:hypothetical protein
MKRLVEHLFSIPLRQSFIKLPERGGEGFFSLLYRMDEGFGWFPLASRKDGVSAANYAASFGRHSPLPPTATHAASSPQACLKLPLDRHAVFQYIIT